MSKIDTHKRAGRSTCHTKGRNPESKNYVIKLIREQKFYTRLFSSIYLMQNRLINYVGLEISKKFKQILIQIVRKF